MFKNFILVIMFIFALSITLMWTGCENVEADPVGFEIFWHANSEVDIDRCFIYTIEQQDTTGSPTWDQMDFLGSFNHDSLLALYPDSTLRIQSLFEPNGESIMVAVRFNNTSGNFCPFGGYSGWLFKENINSPNDPRNVGIRRL